ncbi:hypothetical protein NBRC10512_000898 [Rhodotorula toruloides]|uniref:MFS transporter n=1 Tax=Rhodotorula toruloides (strain NP11) TaxID=1130832 RepID=M7X2G0_RHOT1|nr:MFS transporter [Rhodotorula toruloides NP11]EMS24265.1 MFS transporter [Rhodotorula toruloides NP11]
MSASDIDTEKQSIHQVEEVALHGHVATDKHGHALIHIDPAAEARLRRKMDIRILPVVALMYLFCFIDRANIGNARVAGLEKDLHLKGYDYNILLTAFYTAYVAFEFPCQMINKAVGPGKTLPIFSFLFGLFSMAMAFVHTFGAAIAVRFLLGIAEGAVFPGIAFYLSRFYRKDELGFRLSCYIVCAPAAGAVGGLLASGILKITLLAGFSDGGQSRILVAQIVEVAAHPCRPMIFLIEGIISMGIAIISWFVLADRPEVCGWLTAEEKALAEARIKIDNVGSTVVVDKIHWKAVWAGILNPVTIASSIIFLFDNTVVQGVGFYLPTIIKSIYPTSSTIRVQLLSVPPYVLGSLTTLATGYFSWKTRNRTLYMMMSAPFVMLGFAMYIGSMNAHVRYAAAFMVAIGAFSFGSLCTAFSAANVTSDTARAAALGTTVFMGNVGGLISTWTFLPRHAPRYLPGNAFNLAGSSIMLILSIAIWLWMRKENRAKENGRDDHYIEGKTDQEIADLNQKHPAFRFAY